MQHASCKYTFTIPKQTPMAVNLCSSERTHQQNTARNTETSKNSIWMHLMCYGIYYLLYNFSLRKKTNTNIGSPKMASPSQSGASSSILALRSGLFPNESSPFPTQMQRLRRWKGQTAAQSLQDGVCWQPLEPLSYFSACSATSHPTLYHTSALRCCTAHGFNSLVAFQRCLSHIQHCRFDPPAKFYSDVSAKKSEVVIVWKKQFQSFWCQFLLCWLIGSPGFHWGDNAAVLCIKLVWLVVVAQVQYLLISKNLPPNGSWSKNTWSGIQHFQQVWLLPQSHLSNCYCRQSDVNKCFQLKAPTPFIKWCRVPCKIF